jgi:diguanylate cyclase (GGDEF)-like protein
MSLRRSRFWSVVLLGVLAGAAAAGFLGWRGILFPRYDSIKDLKEVAVHAPVRLLGVVTYADGPGKRFWLQDQTEAIAVPADPAAAGVSVGETVVIDAVKSAPYKAADGSGSVHLQNVVVHHSLFKAKMPQPLAASLGNFPSADKNGTLVQMTVIVRDAYLDGVGRAHLEISDNEPKVDAIVAHPDPGFERLVNAKVRLVGLPEASENAEQRQPARLVWVNAASNLKVVEAAPPSDPLYTIRDVYCKKPATTDGHRIRIRGKVLALSGEAALIEDEFGAVEARLARTARVHVGDMVEAAGFPVADGVREDLFYAQIAPVVAAPVQPAGAAGFWTPFLTTVEAVRALPSARAAQALPVHVSGVITFFDSSQNEMFLQDSTGGIYVSYPGQPAGLRLGERVTLHGMTNSGDFAPVIVAASIHDDGPGRLPRPIEVSYEAAASGRLDSQYATLEGIVHPLKFGERPNHPILTFKLYTSIGEIHIFTAPGFPDLRASTHLEDAKIRLEGVFATAFNARRQLLGYRMAVASPDQVKVLEPPTGDAFAIEATPVGSLLHFSANEHFGHRVKVAGSVTAVGRDYFYLQDKSGGVEVQGSFPPVHLSDRIQAAGYPTLDESYSLRLSDAVVRIAQGEEAVQPVPTAGERLFQGDYDSRLITVQGRLLTSLHTPGSCSLVLQAGVQSFTAELNTTDLGTGACDLTEGAMLQLTGVSSSQTDPTKLYRLLEKVPVTIKVLLRGRDDIVVVSRAPFWSLRNTIFLLILVSALALVVLLWVSVLGRKVRRQRAALDRASQTAQAICELSAAMQEVSREGRFDSEVSVRGSEDIAQLVVGFNGMITELRKRDRAKREAESRLRHQALVDELTGLPNRRLLSDRLTQSLSSARREKKLVGLLFIDLDGFKSVNDSFGHAAGDMLLTEVAQRFRSRARESDTLARIGGDEFTVILNHVKSKEDVGNAAESFLESLRAPFSIANHEITIGASIGISLSTNDRQEDGDLLQQADSAMYVAKRDGKNRVVHFSKDLGISVRERFTLELDLRRALSNREITVSYQPEFDLKTNTIIRFEALARWNHPTLGNIPPLQFIPVAEETGLIVPLGAQILEMACTEARSWQELVPYPIQVAVNVSGVQFARESFIDEVKEVLARTGLPASLLQLELTESATLLDIQKAASAIQRLKEIGVTVAIDDFGTGYSCLSYLPKLSFNALKIDRSFVRDMIESPEAKALVESILALARNLNMKVIVEGIENHEQLRMIGELGGKEAQGYLLGRPTPEPIDVLRRSLAEQGAAERVAAAV